MDTDVMQKVVLAFTEDEILPVSAVLNVMRELGDVPFEQCDPQIITQASALSQLPVESSSIDIVICLCRSLDFPGDQVFDEISRVLKTGGTIMIYKNLKSDKGDAEKAVTALERKLLLAGYLEAQRHQLKSVSPGEFFHSFVVKGKKASWKIGSSFPIKKASKGLFKVQMDDDMDLIDEDTLLTEDDLKKPEVPSVDDCEVGSTRKACRNCTCGRAEAEVKVPKLGLTMDQLDNPQSACGSCGLGDAFRCSTCPYKGLPAFKLGEKVQLPGNFFIADI